jgi:hypothetical protein
MTEIEVIVTGPEEAYDNEAEFWRANELMGVTVLHEGRPSVTSAIIGPRTMEQLESQLPARTSSSTPRSWIASTGSSAPASTSTPPIPAMASRCSPSRSHVTTRAAGVSPGIQSPCASSRSSTSERISSSDSSAPVWGSSIAAW